MDLITMDSITTDSIIMGLTVTDLIAILSTPTDIGMTVTVIAVKRSIPTERANIEGIFLERSGVLQDWTVSKMAEVKGADSQAGEQGSKVLGLLRILVRSVFQPI